MGKLFESFTNFFFYITSTCKNQYPADGELWKSFLQLQISFFFLLFLLSLFLRLPTFANTKGVSKMRNFTGKLGLNDASFFFQSSHILNIYNTISYWEYFFCFWKNFSDKRQKKKIIIKRNSNSSPVVLSTSNVGAVFLSFFVEFVF